MGKQWKQWQPLFFWASKITADGDCSHEIKRQLLLGRKVTTNLDSVLKSRHYFANKVRLVQAIVFSSSHVWMWELDYKESWVLKNWCFWTVVLEKILESLLDCKETQPVHRKGDQSWVFIGRTDVEAETPILWPPQVKSWLIWERLKAGEEGVDRGWDGWMPSRTQWRRVWVNSGSWWWTWRPGVLWSLGSGRVRRDWVTELNWTELCIDTRHFLDGAHTWYCISILVLSPDAHVHILGFWSRYRITGLNVLHMFNYTLWHRTVSHSGCTNFH